MENLIGALSALSHPQRLALFALLMRRYPDRLPAGEIGAALGAKPSTLSAYLADLESAGLIDHDRQGTSLRYRARLDAAQGLMDGLLGAACRGRADPAPAPPPGRVRNVLFLGTGNAARSLMAEAILRDLAGPRFEAFSAGTQPQGAPDPRALSMLRELGHDTGALYAKPLAALGSPRVDVVLTLCDRAANAALPAWPGRPIQGHWGLPDPVALATADGYAATYLTLRARLTRLAALPADLPRAQVQRLVDDLARQGPDPD